MFQKNSYSIPSDSSGIFLARVIETRRCSSLRHAKVCKFLKVVLRITAPELLKLQKKKRRSIVVRTKHYLRKVDGLFYCFVDNALVILKKRMNTLGKELYGPTSKFLRIKKFRVAYKFAY